MDRFHITWLFGDGKRGSGVFPATQTPIVLLQKEWNVLDQQTQIIELYDEVRSALHSYLSTLRVSPTEAEDVIQEAFARLIRYISEGNKVNNLRGWLFRVVHNLSMDLHRNDDRDKSPVYEESEMPVQEQVDPSLNPEQQYLYEERMKRLSSAVEQLTPQQRQCVLLRAEGMRYHLIAEIVGITTQRAAVLVQRGLVRLAAFRD